MYSLVYVSSAIDLLSKQDLTVMLRAAQRKNAAAGITGMLLYKGGNFMQVLEGEEDAVKSLYSAISFDPRHKGLILLMAGPIEARRFPKWSMAFRDMHDARVADLEGFSDFLNTELSAKGIDSKSDPVCRLLRDFKGSM